MEWSCPELSKLRSSCPALLLNHYGLRKGIICDELYAGTDEEDEVAVDEEVAEDVSTEGVERMGFLQLCLFLSLLLLPRLCCLVVLP